MDSDLGCKVKEGHSRRDTKAQPEGYLSWMKVAGPKFWIHLGCKVKEGHSREGHKRLIWRMPKPDESCWAKMLHLGKTQEWLDIRSEEERGSKGVCRSNQGTLGVVRSMDLDKCIKDEYPSLYYQTEYFHCPPNPLCSSYSSLLPRPGNHWTFFCFLSVSILLPFPQWHINGLIQHVPFWNWLLSFSNNAFKALP